MYLLGRHPGRSHNGPALRVRTERLIQESWCLAGAHLIIVQEEAPSVPVHTAIASFKNRPEREGPCSARKRLRIDIDKTRKWWSGRKRGKVGVPLSVQANPPVLL